MSTSVPPTTGMDIGGGQGGSEALLSTASVASSIGASSAPSAIAAALPSRPKRSIKNTLIPRLGDLNASHNGSKSSNASFNEMDTSNQNSSSLKGIHDSHSSSSAHKKRKVEKKEAKVSLESRELVFEPTINPNAHVSSNLHFVDRLDPSNSNYNSMLIAKKLPGMHSNYDKLRREIENTFLERCNFLKSIIPSSIHTPLPEGPRDIRDINTAIQLGVKDSSVPIINWRNDPHAKRIGSRCKVYWDGDNEWFYARILNYDRHFDKYFIFYEQDCTGEWIDLKKETVLIGEQILLCKLKSGAIYPAMKYWSSEKAKNEALNTLKGYVKNYEYVEFFNDKGLGEYGFISEQNFLPILGDNIPRRTTKTFDACMASAKREQETVDSVVEMVIPAIKRSVFAFLYGEQWIGLRVRASAHILASGVQDSSENNLDNSNNSGNANHINSDESGTANKTADNNQSANENSTSIMRSVGMRRQNNSIYTDDDELSDYENVCAKCVGTIVNFCPNLNMHFIVFDEPLLQPKWVNCTPDSIELLLGNEEEVAFPGPSSSSSSSSTTLVSNFGGGSCSEATAGVTSTVNPVSTEVSDPNGLVLTMNDGDSNSNAKLIIRDNTNNVCKMCNFGFESNRKSFECTKCHDHYHPYCMPSKCEPLFYHCIPRTTNANSKMMQTATAEYLKNLNSTVCWKCRSCDGCKNSSWKYPLLLWNLRYVDASSPDKETVVCVDCYNNYKSSNVFCPICYKIYSTEDSSSCQYQEIDSEILNEDLNMVQCNECSRWVHALCEGIDQAQYESMTKGTHPVWGEEYLCPHCRISISLKAVQTLQGFDNTAMFASPVTEEVAKNYFDIIHSPMDLSTMFDKAGRGQYKSMQILRQDFELMCLNALLFNKVGDEYWTDAKEFYHKGESIFTKSMRITHTTAYGAEIINMLSAHNISKDSKVKGNSNKKQADALEQKKKEPKPPRNQNADWLDEYDPKRNHRIKKRSSLELLSGGVGSGGVGIQENEGNSEQVVEYIDINSPKNDNKNEEVIQSMAFNDDSDILNISYPTSLVKAPTPSSFYPCYAFTVSIDESVFASCMDACLLCGSSGSSEYFIFCIDCGEAFHSFCIETPLLTMSKSARLNWRCMNCKICEICGESTDVESNKMIYCENCDFAFHSRCLDPILNDIPSTSWYCANCVQCESRLLSTPSVAISSSSSSSRGKNHLNVAAQIKEINQNLFLSESESCSWGLDLKKCYKCDIIQKEVEKNRRSDDCCAICDEPWKDIFVSCSSCKLFFHPTCLTTTPNSTYNFCSVGSKFFTDWMCDSCLENQQIALQNSSNSHIFSNDMSQSNRILKKITQIQRTRSTFQDSNRKDSLSTLRGKIINSFEPTEIYFRAILTWGIKRIQFLEQTAEGANYFKSKRFATDVNSINELPIWVFNRAKRFSSMILMKSLNDREKLLRLDCLTNFKSRINNGSSRISLKSLSKYASMAASFIHYTSAEIGAQQSYEEISQVAIAFLGPLQIDPTLNLNEAVERRKHEEMIFNQKISEFVKITNNTLTSLLCPPIGLRDLEFPSGYLEGASFDTDVAITPDPNQSHNIDRTIQKELTNIDESSKINENSSILTNTNQVSDVKKMCKWLHWGPFSSRNPNQRFFKSETLRKKTDLTCEDKVSNNKASRRKPGPKPKHHEMMIRNESNDKMDENVNKFNNMGVNFSGRYYGLKTLSVEFGDSNFYAKKCSVQQIDSNDKPLSIPLNADKAIASCVRDLANTIEIAKEEFSSAKYSTRFITLPNANSGTLLSAQENNLEFTSASDDSEQQQFKNNLLLAELSARGMLKYNEIIESSLLHKMIGANEITEESYAAEHSNENEFSHTANLTHAAVINRDASSQTLTQCPAQIQNAPISAASDDIKNSAKTQDIKVESSEVVSADDKISMQVEVESTVNPAPKITSDNNVDHNLATSLSGPSNQSQVGKSVETNQTDMDSNELKVSSFFENLSYRERGIYPHNSRLTDALTASPANSMKFEKDNESNSSKNQNLKLASVPSMKGWKANEMGSQMQWFDYRFCIFCREAEDDIRLGRLIQYSDGAVCHVNCIRYCHEITETKGVLINSTKVRNKLLRKICIVCKNIGASVSCFVKSCNRNMHFKCALALNCATFIAQDLSVENEDGTEIDVQNSSFPIRSCVSCPEHIVNIWKSPIYNSFSDPTDPRRFILTDDYTTSDSESLSAILCQRRLDRVIRSGSLLIHSGGVVSPQLSHFHNEKFIYPLNFRSSRIFWSTVEPFQRTMYIFEIIAEADLSLPEGMDGNGLLSLYKAQFIGNANFAAIAPLLGVDMKEYSLESNKKQDCAILSSAEYPVFRLVSMENPQAPLLLARTVEELFAMLITLVKQIVPESYRRHQFDSYCLDPHQFFGIGLPCVRQAIEFMPESVAAMLSTETNALIPRYRPSYKLPNCEDIRRLHRLLGNQWSKWRDPSSVRSCARLDSVEQHVVRFRPQGRQKFLTKSVEDEGSKGDALKDDENNEIDMAEADGRQNNQAVLELNYAELSRAYLLNPMSKLEVKKSHIHGYGLFSRTHFDKNDMIVEYIGERVRQTVADKREIQYEDEGVGSCYLFRLDKDEIVDATRCGGMARFMNHCCEPNAYARIIVTHHTPNALNYGDSNFNEHTMDNSANNIIESKHIVIFAARDIEDGEEITYDYKFPIETSNKLRCFCGAPKCVGFMN